MPGRHSYRHAGVATVLALGTLAALLVFDPGAAADLTRENHVVEWVQVGLFTLAAVAALTAARRPPATLDVLLVLLFLTFVELETDLDRRLFGRSVIDKHFLVDARVPLLPRLLTVICLLVLVLGVAAYAWRRRAHVISAARQLVRAPWGRVLITGLGLLVAVELFEKSLEHALSLPKYFVEESLELLAALYCAIAMVDHARDASS